MAKNIFETIIEEGIRKEKEAHDFYINIADMIMDEPTKALLREIAAEELVHKEKLEGIKNTQEPIDLNKPVENKSPVYIVAKQFSADMTRGDVLAIAMKKEKEAFEFYTSLAKAVSNEKIKNFIIALSQEELAHQKKLADEYRKISRSEDTKFI